MDSSALPAARLTLRPPTFPPGPVSGAWWPRSNDLPAELPTLIKAFDISRARVTRATAHRDTWPGTDAATAAQLMTAAADPGLHRTASRLLEDEETNPSAADT